MQPKIAHHTSSFKRSSIKDAEHQRVRFNAEDVFSVNVNFSQLLMRYSFQFSIHSAKRRRNSGFLSFATAALPSL